MACGAGWSSASSGRGPSAAGSIREGSPAGARSRCSTSCARGTSSTFAIRNHVSRLPRAVPCSSLINIVREIPERLCISCMDMPREVRSATVAARSASKLGLSALGKGLALRSQGLAWYSFEYYSGEHGIAGFFTDGR